MAQDYLQRNPLLDVRKRDRNAKPSLDKDADAEVRRLTDWQWSYLLETLTQLASANPKCERNLFVIVTMKSLFLRVSELAPRPVDRGQMRTPSFSDFRRTIVDGEPTGSIPSSARATRPVRSRFQMLI